MKFGSQIQPGDIDYNNIKKLCGTPHFLETFNRELIAWKDNGKDPDIERNFIAGIKLLKKHQKRLIGRGFLGETIDLQNIFTNNPVFAQHYHKFSRKYPEFFLQSSCSLHQEALRRSSTQIIAHRA